MTFCHKTKKYFLCVNSIRAHTVYDVRIYIVFCFNKMMLLKTVVLNTELKKALLLNCAYLGYL